MDKNFEQTHRIWLEGHLSRREGERKRRLEEGHMYLEKALLEKIWWPAFGSLEDVHPEYEVHDFNDGRRYIDHAYKPKGLRLALEADGFNPHVRNIDRWDYADNLLRDVHLVADGWTVLHFSYDVIHYRSRQAQQLLRQIVWGAAGRRDGSELAVEAREIIRFAKRKGGPVTPNEVSTWISRSRNTAAKLLHELLNQKLLRPVNPDAKHVRAYELTPLGRDLWL